MTPPEYKAALKQIGETQIGFAKLLGAKARTGQYWASTAVPPAVALIVRFLLERPEMLPVFRRLGGSGEDADDDQ